MNTYDVIVIGSGIGGLSAASLLAQISKKRVLVLERHFKLGGFTHAFSRKGYTWDVGLHYVGGMQPGSQARNLFDFITGSTLQWQRFPEHFDRFVYPDFSFAVPANQEAYLHSLIDMFPHEAAALKLYFRDVKRLFTEIGMEIWRWSVPTWLRIALSPLTIRTRYLASLSTKDYLNKHFKDEQLKALLTSQWGDYGLTPSQSSFATHALVSGSYFEGAWYPVGGSKQIAERIVPIIQHAGGEALVNHEVTEILLKDNQACGVKVKVGQGTKYEEKAFYAPLIISDAGAVTTLTRLLPQAIKQPLPRHQGYSVVTLYLGLKQSPAALGLEGENLWIYSGYNHDEVMTRSQDLATGKIRGAFVSFASLHDPEARQHTAQVIVPADSSLFEAWKDETWQKRSQSYETFKDTLSEAILQFVEHHYPGFRNLVDYHELSTPLTIAHFTGHAQGNIYGFPGTPAKYRHHLFAVNTPVKQLLLTGTDVVTPGIQGALMGGAFTAGYVLNPITGFSKVMNVVRNYAKQDSVKTSRLEVI